MTTRPLVINVTDGSIENALRHGFVLSTHTPALVCERCGCLVPAMQTILHGAPAWQVHRNVCGVVS